MSNEQKMEEDFAELAKLLNISVEECKRIFADVLVKAAVERILRIRDVPETWGCDDPNCETCV